MVHEREDEGIKRVIEETKHEVTKKQEMKVLLENKAKSIKKELEVVYGALALCSGFLAQNSIVTSHSATQDYLRPNREEETLWRSQHT